MRRPGLVWLIALVLIANAAVLWKVWRNRGGAAEAEISLTQRELSYRPGSEEGGVFLFLNTVLDQTPEFDAGRLRALGYDVQPGRRLLPRDVFVALAYTPSEEEHSGLKQVDVASTAQELRRRFPDRSRVIILPGQIFPQPGKASAYIGGVPRRIHVPPPLSRLFDSNPKAYEVRLAIGANLEPWVVSVKALPDP